jgi:TPR repeat protein
MATARIAVQLTKWLVSRLTVLLLVVLIPTFADMQAGWRAYLAGDFQAVLQEWLPLAKQGNAEAQIAVGGLYVAGKGVPKDYVEAAKWYRLAAEQGNAQGEEMLGTLYLFGNTRDYKEAEKWLRLAAKHGDATAFVQLGYMYNTGSGVPRDQAEALKLYLTAAQKGLPLAQHQVGQMYAKGEGADRDFAEAIKWHRLAAAQGFRESQRCLALAYRDGTGIRRDYAEALKWFRAAVEPGADADKGDAESQANLGWMYTTGTGVQQDTEEAKKWFRLAAEQGNAYAKQSLEQLNRARKPNTEGVTGGPILWSDYKSGDYTFTLFNNRAENVKNVSCQVVFFDVRGKMIDTDLVRYDGVIPAGLGKRIASKVDPVVHQLTAAEFYFNGAMSQAPGTRIDVRIVDFEIVH